MRYECQGVCFVSDTFIKRKCTHPGEENRLLGTWTVCPLLWFHHLPSQGVFNVGTCFPVFLLFLIFNHCLQLNLAIPCHSLLLFYFHLCGLLASSLSSTDPIHLPAGFPLLPQVLGDS